MCSYVLWIYETQSKIIFNIVCPLFVYWIYWADTRWDFVGSTIITNNYVRLTSDERSQQGAIWNNVVCTSIGVI
jgi:Legume-like lectin family